MRYAALILAAAFLGAAPVGLEAQSVTPQEAADFLGNWSASIDSPQGAIDMNIDLVDADGMLEGSVQGPDGAMTLVDEITLDGSTLTLSYEVDFGGTPIPISLELEPSDTGLAVMMSGAGGQFTADGTASLR